MDDLLRNVRTRALIKLVQPYTRLDLAYISKELNTEVNEVENILACLILEGELRGQINQVTQEVTLENSYVISKFLRR